MLKLYKINKLEHFFVALMILLFIMRGSIPLFKYPFIIIYIGFILYLIFKLKTSDLKTWNLLKFQNTYNLFLLQIVFYLYAIFITDKMYLVVIKDFINILFIFSFYFILHIITNKLEDLQYFLKSLNILIIVLSLLISIYTIGNTFFLFSNNDLSFNIDYNFAILPNILGMIGLVYYILKSNKKINGFLTGFTLLIFTIPILLSGSRRGLIVLVFLLICFLISQILVLFYRKRFYLKLKFTFAVFSISLICLLAVCFIFITKTPSSFKNRSLIKIGSQNPTATKEKIAKNLLRYVNIIDRNTNFNDFYKIIWTPIFDPKDPESGWGYRNHKTVYPLPGDNSDIVPKGSMGYLLDSTAAPNTWLGNAYSYTKACSITLVDTSTVAASVYCYVSKDFNGDWIRIVLSADNLTWIGSNAYNLENKGSWQKLETISLCSDKEVSLFLYVCKNAAQSFKSLNGYVIFAYPQCNTLYQANPVSKVLTKFHGNSVINDLALYDNKITINYPVRYEKASLNPSLLLSKLVFPNKDNDPIRNWISKLISEDTTYYGYHSKIDVETTINPFIDQRRERWKFAWQIYNREYCGSQKIFGGGFNFLNWYGYFFYGNKTRSDYPHNPFLHILLYSGMLGLLFYVILLFNTFRYYLKYLKEYYLFFICFLITYFFSFFSGGNPFDPPILGFFIMLPFFLHSFHDHKKVKKV